MTLAIYQVDLTLLEHTFFASREVGLLYETEPVIGNYALTYALGWCVSPYNWDGPPRYKQDLLPLNRQGRYVTPATFLPGRLRFAFSQFNAQSDSYYFRFDQNAIALERSRKARAMNFPQAGKIRLLAAESRARFYALLPGEAAPALPRYIRLGKFNSKARLDWQPLHLLTSEPQEQEQVVDFFLNAADLPDAMLSTLRSFTLYNIPPAPLVRQARLRGPFWTGRLPGGEVVHLPAGMHYGVETLP
ncbi:type I-D CRISPR-associated protein Cas5/Csc1 [Thermogemmatispora onikobensis]|uniref:type I-D CRISPR-associated protein Cas5/Csc1 n=1 Tax=Thermogemmatispora onikobensis TaxID=732234 RepID=UPI000853878D|nr:type I-D CRISPR-associated protein Cas5/Csc1 [Thermogemmatispora onikobensis]